MNMLLSQSGQFGPEAFHLLLKQRENGKREWSSPKREREEGQNILRASVMSVAQGQDFALMISVMSSVLGTNFKRSGS